MQACFLVGGQETQGEKTQENKTQVPKLNKNWKNSRKFSKKSPLNWNIDSKFSQNSSKMGQKLNKMGQKLNFK